MIPMQTKLTDDEIRHILDTRTDYGYPDEWYDLAEQATDPHLRQECLSRASTAHHAEEYYAGIL